VEENEETIYEKEAQFGIISPDPSPKAENSDQCKN
jgi:hypothetical protein